VSIDHQEWAAYLAAGVDERRELTAITKTHEDLSIDDAYAIQAALLELQLGRGDTLAGAKLGLTSVAKQEQMGVTEPVYGWVRASTVLSTNDDGVAAASLSDFIHPRVEPELVFRMGEDLAGPGVTAGDALDATAEVLGGIEVIDSRYEAFSFTLPDVIADNTSAAAVAIGSDGVGPRDVDLTTLGCVFEIDGATAGTATGAALLDSPAECLAMLANHLGKHGQKLAAGWIVMAGAPTDAKPLSVGTVATARYSALGSVTVTGV
jgi:2-oxo-3-hexenedioate decarboxylase